MKKGHPDRKNPRGTNKLSEGLPAVGKQNAAFSVDLWPHNAYLHFIHNFIVAKGMEAILKSD